MQSLHLTMKGRNEYAESLKHEVSFLVKFFLNLILWGFAQCILIIFTLFSLPNPEPLPDFVSSFYKTNPVQFVLPYIPGCTVIP